MPHTKEPSAADWAGIALMRTVRSACHTLSVIDAALEDFTISDDKRDELLSKRNAIMMFIDDCVPWFTPDHLREAIRILAPFVSSDPVAAPLAAVLADALDAPRTK